MRNRGEPIRGLPLCLILALWLSGCGSVERYARSREPHANGEVVRLAIATTFRDAKLTGTPMVSRIYEANPVSPGDWLICLRGSSSPARDTYAVYFTGYTFVTAQRAVVVDRCDEQAYMPYVAPPKGAMPGGEPLALAPR
jgi:hypothetical protein